MAVDITPSLETGEMEFDMVIKQCNHYSIGYLDNKNDVEYMVYCYISRLSPDSVSCNSSKGYAQFIHTNNKEYETGFLYQNEIYMNHYYVLNPENAGAVGIMITPNGRERTLIASGSLSGCGFAILIRGDNIFVIHAGGSNDAKEELPVEQRRKMINRDIFLMANALDQPEQYAKIPKNRGGMTCEELFCNLQEMKLKGFIYVQKDYQQLICDSARAKLAISSYYGPFIHDVVCVMNEKGNMSSTMRRMQLHEHDYITKAMQNELLQT